MRETARLLKGDFIVLDLGSAHTKAILKSSPGLAEAITLIETDPLLERSAGARESNRICLKQAVAGKPGQRTFKKRKFPDCSSFLEPKEGLIRAYGLEDYFVQVGSVELECVTLDTLLEECGVRRVDFLKTDLEGMDFEVLSSVPSLIEQCLCLQSELRFQPFYEGEPPFYEVNRYLADRGFELVSLKNSVWKYATGKRDVERDGRTVWTDAIFFLTAKSIQERFANDSWKAFAKQVILGRLLGLTNLAEYLLAQNNAAFPEEVRRELARFVAPHFSIARAVVAQINKLPFGWMLLGATRRFFRYGYVTSALYPPSHVGGDA
jgi:FkbM family methyltransferase